MAVYLSRVLPFRPVAIVTIVLLTACGPTRSTANDTHPEPDGSAVILRGPDLGGGNLLDAMRTRVQNVSVTTSQTGCPRITFRGRRANPSIYIDGTLLGDSCALQNVSTSDVEFVEIYRSGNTRRPGYRNNPGGLILVFRVR